MIHGGPVNLNGSGAPLYGDTAELSQADRL
jgi:hypothetical protein